MYYLKIISGPQSGQVTEVNFARRPEVENEMSFIIGRDVPEGLSLLSDTKVSRHHTAILQRGLSAVPTAQAGAEIFVKDLNSTNGTFINTKRITEEKLAVGAIVRIGNTVLEFADKSGAPAGGDEALGSSTVEIKLDEEAERLHQKELLGKEVHSKILPTLHKITRICTVERDVNIMLEKILKLAAETVDADDGYVVMLDKNTEHIVSPISYHKGSKPATQRTTGQDSTVIKAQVSQTIIKRVAQLSRPLLTTDALLDQRLSPSHSIVSQNIKSVICVPLIATGTHYWVLYLDSNKLDWSFGQEDLELVGAIAIHTGIAIVAHSAAEKSERVLTDTVRMLVTTIEMKDPNMQGHSERVANYALALGRQLKLTGSEVHKLQLAALLHDIGKIGLTTNGLRQSEAKEHLAAAEKILAPMTSLKEIMPIIKYHHERADGSGVYQMKDTDIPLLSKIVSVANVLDNLMAYGGIKGEGLAAKEAIDEIEQQSGKEFDRAIIQTLVATYNEGNLFKASKLFGENA
ncbi:MAG: HD domain-containing protein [Planctomycetes bacterium]|nr:HD domain-containing protein [Planctomycetota bacterium]